MLNWPRLFARLALLPALFVLAGSGCALYGFDEDGGFDIPVITEETFEIPIDLTSLPSSGQMAPAGFEVQLDLPPYPVDLLEVDPEIRKNQDKIESIEVTAIRVKPLSNTVTADLPEIDLAIGPFQATDPSAGTRVATIPVIPAMSTAELEAQIDVDGMLAAQQWISELQFSFIPSALLVVEEGDTVPGGEAVLEITVRVEATVDATK